MKIAIEYDAFADLWVVSFEDGIRKAQRRYGTIKTLVGALEEHAQEIRNEARKRSE